MIELPTNMIVPAEGLALARTDLAALRSCEELAEQYLSGTEWAEWAECRHPGRRLEWLGVRVCLKNLLSESGAITDPKQVIVKKGERGRPQLIRQVDGTDFPGDCSLSHAQSWGVAAWTGEPGHKIGVDIEQISPRLSRVRGAFASAEDHAVTDRPVLEQLTIWWCLKEAFSKAVGLGLGAGLSEIACHETTPGRHRMRHETGCEMTGGHSRFEDFVIAWCDYDLGSSFGSVSLTTT